MLASIVSAVVHGVEGHPVSVEVHVSSGLPGYTLVGMPDASCRESRDRVRAALLSSGFQWPNRRVTINLAPTGLRKEGAALDLPIALALLAASGQIPLESLQNIGAVGELGLDGSIRPVAGLACLASAAAVQQLYVPLEGAQEAAAVAEGMVRGADSLAALVEGLIGRQPLLESVEAALPEEQKSESDLSQVLGQPLARWALEISAAGGHHLLMVGPPGAGKTMLAKRLVGLLPDLSPQESLEVTKIHSAAGLSIPGGGLIRRPPYRAPHHGASLVAMVGGGAGVLHPGEVSCAHHGVLFLDELGEYPVQVVESLRQPLEEGVIRVSRAVGSITFPSSFLLVAAMNPCPCGNGGVQGRCRCSEAARFRYMRRLSAPIVDRFDLRVEVKPPTPELLFEKSSGETSDEVALRIKQARKRANMRGVRFNAALSSNQIEKYTILSPEARRLFEEALVSGRLTGRGLKRVRAVSLTIADLLGEDGEIGAEVAASALGLRSSLHSILGV